MSGDQFSDLPDALVRDLLAVAEPVAETVRDGVSMLASSATALREKASELLRQKADLDRPREPSVAAVDGSYQIHTLTSVDLCAAAAIAVEGPSKEAARHWPEPFHRIWAGGVRHAIDATGVLRALMVSMELDLASHAPHDLVLLDGSLGSLIIYLNQGLSTVDEVPKELGAQLEETWVDGDVMGRLLGLLQSDRTVAVPKFTSRNELARAGPLRHDPVARSTDGRTLATLILRPGEYTAPLLAYVSPEGEPETYHLPRRVQQQDRLNDSLHEVHAVYFRPYGWVPALRLELPGPIARSDSRLSMVLEGIERQFFSPAVVEPYPLFMADRMVKSLGSGVAVLEQTVAQHVVDGALDVQTAMLCMQSYRTQGGRGGTA